MVLNIANIVLLLVLFGFTWLLFPGITSEMILLFDNEKNIILLLPLMLGYFALHEILHAIGYVVNGANPKKITFGMELEKSVLYCLCKDDVSKKNILFSLMYPLFFIGIVTYIVSVIFNMPYLLLLSIFNIGGAIGDILYFLFIVKLDKDIRYSEMDDGTSFAIISKKDPSKYQHFGLDYVGEVNEISRKDFKRIKISKFSWIFIIISIIACLTIAFDL